MAQGAWHAGYFGRTIVDDESISIYKLSFLHHAGTFGIASTPAPAWAPRNENFDCNPLKELIFAVLLLVGPALDNSRHSPNNYLSRGEDGPLVRLAKSPCPDSLSLPKRVDVRDKAPKTATAS